MTTAPDPFLAATREVIERSLGEMRQAIAGLPPQALNWRPAGDDTNSIAVLATHSLHSTRWWLSVALGEPLPARDRPSEFRASDPDAGSLLRLLEKMSADCLALVEKDRDVDWSAVRQTPERVSAAWALVHALSHLREHAGQIFLTRQLWEQR
ncbi:MAG: DinB family protein [Chloroflexi bacterium]|nr:DinB family protein [Chloroflexota bacterium]